MVVIRTWFIAKSFLLFITCTLIHRSHRKLIFEVRKAVTSLACWGRVVIGSLLVYQVIGAGSNPVASTTVLTVLARSIGNGQKSCSRYAWEGLERSGPFPIPSAYRATLLFSILRFTIKSWPRKKSWDLLLTSHQLRRSMASQSNIG